MKLYMSACLLSLALFSTNSWSHGFIERIECSAMDDDTKLVGVESESTTESELYFELESSAHGNHILGVAKYSLEDVFDGTRILEKVQVEFSGIGATTLLIPEIYEQRERSGTGTLNLAVPSVAKVMNCTVVYEE